MLGKTTYFGPRCLNRAPPPCKLVTIGASGMTRVNEKGAFTIRLSIRPPGLSEVEGWPSRTHSFPGFIYRLTPPVLDIAVCGRKMVGNKILEWSSLPDTIYLYTLLYFLF